MIINITVRDNSNSIVDQTIECNFHQHPNFIFFCGTWQIDSKIYASKGQIDDTLAERQTKMI